MGVFPHVSVSVGIFSLAIQERESHLSPARKNDPDFWLCGPEKGRKGIFRDLPTLPQARHLVVLR